MKIHELVIENMASLKGKHSINFDMISNDSGLFAITGKTGAGKSTILNCISLALYNNVYKQDSKSNDFVTLGESEGSIELIFSTDTHKYKAFWQMRLKKKNGEYLKDPKGQRVLSILQGDQYRAIDEDIAEIINLNFEQFCKTCILNQGQFAKFLTSKFNERKGILEKFYSGLNIDKINTAINEKLRTQKGLIDEFRNQIYGINKSIENIEINESTLKTLKKNIDEKEEQQAILKSLKIHFDETLQSYSLSETNKSRLFNTNEQLKSSRDKLNEKNITLKQVETKYSKLDSFSKDRLPILRKCIENNAHILTQKSKLADLQHNFQNIDADLAKDKAHLKTQNELNAELNQALAKISAMYTDHQEFEKISLKNIKSEQIKLFQQINHCEEKMSMLSTEIFQSTQEINKAKTETQQIKERLEQLNQNKLSEEFSEKKSTLQLLENLRSQILSAIEADRHSRQELTTKKSSLESILKDLKEHENEIYLLNNQKKMIENNKLLNEITTAIHTCQIESEKEGRCVVCDSTWDSEVKVFEQVDLNLLDQEKLEIMSKIESTEGLISRAKVQKLSIQESISKINEASNLKKAQLLSLWNNFSELPLSQNILNEKALLDLDRILKSLKAKITELEERILEFNLKKKELSNLEASTQALEEVLQSKNQQFKSATNDLKQYKTDYTDNLNYVQMDKTVIDKEGHQAFELKVENIEQYQSTALKLKENEVRISQTKTNIDVNKTRKTDVTTRIKQTENQIDLLQKFNSTHISKDITPENELAKIESQKKQLEEEKGKLSKEINEHNIIQAEGKSKIAHYSDQIKDCSLLIKKAIEKITDIRNQKKQILSTQTKQLIEKLLDADFSLSDLAPILESTNKLMAQNLEQNQAELKTLTHEYSSQKSLYDQKQQSLAEIKELQKKIDSQNIKLNEFEDLYELVGKDEFRNYILSIIESTLIEQTNLELKQLCQGRYSLSQSNKTNRLITEFKIVDHFSEGLERKVSTLSGGETFLVSLAMALALAELTRGQAKIDSLFIDEGFGTLDHETINEVFELLINIQNSGKQLGIISHVQELTSRIPINLNLQKNSSGHSHIEVIYN